MMVNWPVSTVRLYSSIAPNTVRPIGTSPNATPWANDHPAISSGMPYTADAMTMATTAPAAPAQLASQRRPTSR